MYKLSLMPPPSRARPRRRDRASPPSSICRATLSQLRRHPCYKTLPTGKVFDGRAKTQLSADELCALFLQNDCWFSHVSGDQPSPVRVRTQCHNTSDPVTLEEYTDAETRAPFPNDVITIILPGQTKGECLLRKGLIDYWKAYAAEDVVFVWRGATRSTLDETQPLAKLPISGVWITKRAAVAMVTTKARVFRLRSVGKKYIGTKVHYISSVWGQHETVYDLE